jgi:hypothetical protein
MGERCSGYASPQVILAAVLFDHFVCVFYAQRGKKAHN